MDDFSERMPSVGLSASVSGRGRATSERTLQPGREEAPAGDQMTISGKKDQIKGRVKEATGVLTGDKQLEREGKVDRAAGNVKEKAGEFADDVKRTAGKVVDKVKSTFER